MFTTLRPWGPKNFPFRWPEPESKVLGHELEISFSLDGRSRLLQLAPRLRALVEDGHSEQCLSSASCSVNVVDAIAPMVCQRPL